MKRSNGYFSSDGLVSAPEKNISIEEKQAMCTEFFNDLCNELKDTHTLVKSCNKDYSAYLVPKGTEDQISYSSKPVGSYRISDHWNWYANIKKTLTKTMCSALTSTCPEQNQDRKKGNLQNRFLESAWHFLALTTNIIMFLEKNSTAE